MKKWMKILRWTLLAIGALFFASMLAYGMPRTELVRVTGTEVKRVDREHRQAGESRTRDVRFVYTADLDDGTARAFRNEDAPLYFKFDSGDVAANAMSMAQEETSAEGSSKDDVVLAKYYGWRIPMFSQFPNLLSLKKVPADYVHIPIFNIAFLIILLSLLLWAGVKLRRLFQLAGHKAKALTGRD